MSFTNLGLSPSLCTPLARQGYKEPTPIQAASIPVVLEGADLIARAQTGTGKTAAFGLPMIERLLVRGGQSRRRAPRGLVLAPTRELAMQVHRALLNYGAPVRLGALAIFGGAHMGAQMQALRRGTDIVVATPGRLIDHLERRTVDLSAIEMLVLDEADRMLDMGFLPALQTILTTVPSNRQTLLFSATLSGPIVRLASDFTRDAKRVDVASGEMVAATVAHRVHPVEEHRKRDLLVHVLTQTPTGQALVFCKTKHGSDKVGDHLAGAGLKVAVIHGGKNQGQRTRSLADFKTGRVSVLVATDVAARGLDIAQLPLVVNFDLPLVAEDYVHRVGRTGRAGTPGRALSLVSGPERGLLRQIQRLLPAPLEQVVVSGFEPPPSSHEPSRGRQPHRRWAEHGRRNAPHARRYERRPGDARPPHAGPDGHRRSVDARAPQDRAPHRAFSAATPSGAPRQERGAARRRAFDR
jgi:ATP-dependent RNA helicase RhlE